MDFLKKWLRLGEKRPPPPLPLAGKDQATRFALRVQHLFSSGEELGFAIIEAIGEHRQETKGCVLIEGEYIHFPDGSRVCIAERTGGQMMLVTNLEH